jgi:hypothetical protein
MSKISSFWVLDKPEQQWIQTLLLAGGSSHKRSDPLTQRRLGHRQRKKIPAIFVSFTVNQMDLKPVQLASTKTI